MMPFITPEARPLCMFFPVLPGSLEIPSLSSIFGPSLASFMVDGNNVAQKDGNPFTS